MDFNHILSDDKNLQVLVVDGLKMHPEIQDGGWPPSWKKSKNCHIYATV